MNPTGLDSSIDSSIAIDTAAAQQSDAPTEASLVRALRRRLLEHAVQLLDQHQDERALDAIRAYASIR